MDKLLTSTVRGGLGPLSLTPVMISSTPSILDLREPLKLTPSIEHSALSGLSQDLNGELRISSVCFISS